MQNLQVFNHREQSSHQWYIFAIMNSPGGESKHTFCAIVNQLSKRRTQVLAKDSVTRNKAMTENGGGNSQLIPRVKLGNRYFLWETSYNFS